MGILNCKTVVVLKSIENSVTCTIFATESDHTLMCILYKCFFSGGCGCVDVDAVVVIIVVAIA